MPGHCQSDLEPRRNYPEDSEARRRLVRVKHELNSEVLLGNQVGLSPGVRQTVKTLVAVRRNFIVLPKRGNARWLPASEAEAGSAGVQPAEE